MITDVIIENNAKDTRVYAGCELEVCPIEGDMGTATTQTTKHQRLRSKVVKKGTQTIAGSCANQLDMFYNMIEDLGVSVEKAVTMLSETPARIARVDDQVGSIAVGRYADLLFFDENMELSMVMIGKWITHIAIRRRVGKQYIDIHCMLKSCLIYRFCPKHTFGRRTRAPRRALRGGA